jgi:GNAT superfamily N-acetyltransferase
VAVEDGSVLGFVTVAAAEVEIAGLPASRRKGPPSYPLPALRIARLAVDSRAHGRGIGAELLKQALILARKTAETVGCVGVIVDAKAEAVAFYTRYGFEPATTVVGSLGDRPQPVVLFLPLSLIPEE